MKKWDICLANVPFEDINQTKLRPVVTLDDSAVMIDCLKMTSHKPRYGEYSLQKWQEAGLHQPTTVRISKRLSLTSAHIVKQIGVLHPVDIVELSKRLS